MMALKSNTSFPCVKEYETTATEKKPLNLNVDIDLLCECFMFEAQTEK